MRLSFRLILSLIAGVTAVSLGFAIYQAQTEVRAQRADVQRHALTLAEGLERSVEPLLIMGGPSELQALVDRFQNHERLAGVAVYDITGKPVAITAGLASPLRTTPSPVLQSIQKGWALGQFFRLAGEP